ncbi:hypothetical protein A3860_18465 [Niastella vici]|uniref:Type IV secretion system coupling protein TraD DNA-binding domain-containing protein n=1 Tax=Niastella vici TaxID=1703345 RepID=A0A1V9G297_9BACT|nr:type IV secretion system DNA-binding domain-containing protein [Niastella vici]OQP64743.1 hypothetical protein A3860_18465 [Niastella vici]
MNQVSEELTLNFYEWARRGQGWFVYDTPVDFEPPFAPYFHATVRHSVPDDGRPVSIVSRIANYVLDLFTSKEITTIEATEDEMIPVAYASEYSDIPLRTIGVTLPRDYKVRASEAEQLLLMLSLCRYPISFEIEATENKIHILFVCREPDRLHVAGQLKAYFPGCIVDEQARSAWDSEDGEGMFIGIADLCLSEEFTRPLKMTESIELDPFIGLFSILEHLGETELATIQVLFTQTINPWSESILRSVTDEKGGSFFLNAPEMPALAKEKISSPLYSVVIRVIGQSTTLEQALAIANHVAQSVISSTASNHNSLTILQSEVYSFEDRANDFINRQSHRLGMLLNSKELLTLVHLPGAAVASSKLERDIRKTKAVPAIALGHQLVLGINQHQGIQKAVTLSTAHRVRHTHIIGATGVGKSNIILTSAVQDILNGNGLLVLDPHGDTIDNILPYIPAQRVNDVLLIDPADSEFPIGFNILSAHNDIEKEILSSDLVAAFKRQSTSWGDQMNSVLANAILAFVESNEGGTLVELRRFLVEKAFRDEFLKTVTDPSIVYYWQKEYPLLKSSSIGSILTRLDSFLRPKLIRNMVAQRKSIDFQHLMDTKKIILVKLSHGMMGAENSYLLGTFIVSKIYQAAMARQAQAQENRTPFFVYVDEFQNYATASMGHILEGTRKYGLSLTLAHQGMRQLESNSELASSIIANAGTRICFRLGETDAKKFADGFSYFDAQDLQNLSIGEAIGRIEKSENDFSLTTFQLPASEVPKLIKDQIIAFSRQTYGTPKHIVEQALAESMQTAHQPADPAPKPPIVKRTKEEDLPPHPTEPAEPAVPIEPIESVQQKEKKPLPKSFIQPIPAQIQEITQTSEVEKFKQAHEERLHVSLQNRIKLMAEQRGFKATLEAPTYTRTGFVDVSLERNNKRIAIEISVTTSAAWEMNNIKKCLAEGYDTVIACSPNTRTLENIRTHIVALPETDRAKIVVFNPDALFEYLDTLVQADVPTEDTMQGWHVNVKLRTISDEEAKGKSTAIKRVLASTPKKKKKGT